MLRTMKNTLAPLSFALVLLGSCSPKKEVVAPPPPKADPAAAYKHSENASKVSIDGWDGKIGEALIPETIGGMPVTSIGKSAFADHMNLTTVKIPSGVTSIGPGAFAGCMNLTSLTIENGVVSIGENAFAGCLNLASVTLPASVTIIGNGAFSGCAGLTTINLPEGLTSLGDRSFAGCISLTNVSILAGVSAIPEMRPAVSQSDHAGTSPPPAKFAELSRASGSV